MSVGMFAYFSLLIFISLLPTIVAFWRGEGPWKLAALVVAFPTFIVLATWVPLTISFRGWLSPDSWAPFIAIWSLAWLFAKLAIDERTRERALDRAWDDASAAKRTPSKPDAAAPPKKS